MAPSNNSYLSNVAIFHWTMIFGRKSIVSSTSLHVKSLGKFSVRPNCLPEETLPNLNLFFCPVSSSPNSSPKVQGRFKSSGILPKKPRILPKKKRILRTPTMFRRLPGVLEDRAAIREIVLQNVEKKETAKALRALHRCRPRDVWWFQNLSLYQKIFAKMRKQTSIANWNSQKSNFTWVIQTVGPEVLGSTNLPIYFSVSNTCEKKMSFFLARTPGQYHGFDNFCFTHLPFVNSQGCPKATEALFQGNW